MKRISILSILSIVIVIGCSKKADEAAPKADTTATTTANAASPAKPNAADEEDDGMGMMSGMAGAATGAGSVVAKSTAEAAATANPIDAPEATKRLAMDYLKTTSIGKAHPNEITLARTTKGACDDCWFFTYNIAGEQEVKVQVAGTVASLFGTMKDIKKSK